MPTYDYKCLACENKFEKFQGITAPPLEECPECGGKVKRLIGAGAGLIFKGSGFYITDYRSEGYKESEKKDKSTKSEKSDKSEKKSESKGESKKKSNNSGKSSEKTDTKSDK